MIIWFTDKGSAHPISEHIENAELLDGQTANKTNLFYPMCLDIR